LASISVVEEVRSTRRLYDHLRPPEMLQEFGNPWPPVIKTFGFVRTIKGRSSTFGFVRHREIDKPHELALLTVTFNDCVDRTWEGFHRYAEQGWTIDPDAVCAGMEFRQEWTAVTKIRLRLVSGQDPWQCYWVRLFRQREGDKKEEIKDASWLFEIRPQLTETLARRFVDELKLTHAVVDGMDEYSV